MAAAPPWLDIPDWRHAGAYGWLRQAPTSAFAWEWLRRNPAYRREASEHPPLVWRYGNVAVARGHPAADRWGLHAFVPAELHFLAAQPVWTAQTHPFVLVASADTCPNRRDDLFDLESIGLPETIVRGPGRAEHLLIMAMPAEIRLDIVDGSLFAGAIDLHYRLHGFERVEAPLLVLRRLISLWRSGRVPAALAPPARRAERFIMLLRAHDADRAGATQREIAATLLSRDAAQVRWRTEEPSLRLRAQRLVTTARRMPFNHRQLLR